MGTRQEHGLWLLAIVLLGLCVWPGQPDSLDRPMECEKPLWIKGVDVFCLEREDDLQRVLAWQKTNHAACQIETKPHEIWNIQPAGQAGCDLLPEEMTGRTKLLFGQKLDLNRADFFDLQAIPGIGEVLSRRIVRARQKLSAFRSVEQLLEVSGIGPKTLSRIRAYLRCD